MGVTLTLDGLLDSGLAIGAAVGIVGLVPFRSVQAALSEQVANAVGSGATPEGQQSAEGQVSGTMIVLGVDG